MTANGILQLGLALGLVLACVRPLGWYMARVYSGGAVLDRVSGRERLMYRLLGIDPTTEMTWQRYAGAVLAFGFVSVLAVYGVQRLQAVLPFNPEVPARRLAGLVVQHRRQLRHQHQLAGVRRRNAR